MAKFILTEVSGCQRVGENRELLLKGMEFQLGKMKKVLEEDGDDS